MEICVQLNQDERWLYKNVEAMLKSHSVYETLDTETLYQTCLKHWTKELFEETLNSLLKKGVLVKKKPERKISIDCAKRKKERIEFRYLGFSSPGARHEDGHTFSLHDVVLEAENVTELVEKLQELLQPALDRILGK